MISLWEKYCNKKEAEFKNSEEYKVIQEVLDFMYPDRWELGVEAGDKPQFNDVIDDTHYYLSNYGTERGARLIMNCGRKFSQLRDLKVCCSIYFPELQISNNSGFKHKLRDLYVKIEFSLGNPTLFVELHGFRATLSQTEYLKGYSHSHLPTYGFLEWKRFCKGNSEFGFSLSKEFISKDRNSIMNFLFLMESYLQHESIEGVPYIRMAECQNATTLGSLRINHSDMLSCINKKPPIKLDKNLKIKNREEIEEWLPKNYNRYKAIKIGKNYFSESSSNTVSNMNENQGKVITKFKNQEIKLKIDNYETGHIAKAVSHPKFTEGIIKYWESRIKKTYITKYRTIKKDTCKSATEGTESGEILVSENMGS